MLAAEGDLLMTLAKTRICGVGAVFSRMELCNTAKMHGLSLRETSFGLPWTHPVMASIKLSALGICLLWSIYW
jgi:hypothetical protein